jgi:hypothetical protein
VSRARRDNCGGCTLVRPQSTIQPLQRSHSDNRDVLNLLDLSSVAYLLRPTIKMMTVAGWNNPYNMLAETYR